MGHKKVKIGKKILKGFCIPLGKKKLVGLVGKNGYIMCGYLNLKTADKFGEVAVKVKGVDSIGSLLKAQVFALSREAKKLGIYKGQPIKDVIRIIA
ncbi:MAG: DUF1805 domain-containing protein [Candidatus Omnitrophota bacterium]|nr:DUF1805 domain-containing protein [Candidatus Omnitrophota bacterium]RKY33610.1 MAG: DUF1805 domain-containing protein [Candidatus Omnitrophota bacterium]RKY36832.1 MAG: DUF1805 domain-containing protein [Candidatus Omnitrophota bacterium]RKY45959.1 MAG: DUF1805 domain-containing protein [Candidatus Omnitrophota bacterium]HDN85759.1 DUF1805 domain-containing protein [Candidatus Omnitrophota bacterium]